MDIPLVHANVPSAAINIPRNDNQHQTAIASTSGPTSNAAAEISSKIVTTRPQNALYPSLLPIQQGMQRQRQSNVHCTLVLSTRGDTTNPHSNLPNYGQNEDEHWVVDVATQQDGIK